MNTRQHAVQALKLEGVSRDMPIGVVSSSWHLRRAKLEFQRYFSLIHFHSLALSNEPAGVRDLIPDPDSLSNTTTYLREWVGLAWYYVTGIIGLGM